MTKKAPSATASYPIIPTLNPSICTLYSIILTLYPIIPTLCPIIPTLFQLYPHCTPSNPHCTLSYAQWGTVEVNYVKITKDLYNKLTTQNYWHMSCNTLQFFNPVWLNVLIWITIADWITDQETICLCFEKKCFSLLLLFYVI